MQPPLEVHRACVAAMLCAPRHPGLSRLAEDLSSTLGADAHREQTRADAATNPGVHQARAWAHRGEQSRWRGFANALLAGAGDPGTRSFGFVAATGYDGPGDHHGAPFTPAGPLPAPGPRWPLPEHDPRHRVALGMLHAAPRSPLFAEAVQAVADATARWAADLRRDAQRGGYRDEVPSAVAVVVDGETQRWTQLAHALRTEPDIPARNP